MGMKFLNKKGWHTGSLRNIENVWKAEQKQEAEQKKLEELRLQIVQERERSEFRALQEQAGLIPRQERLEFLYDSGLAVGKGSSSSSGHGVSFQKQEEQPAKADAVNSSNDKQEPSVPGALFEEKAQSANDSWRKLHSDPLLLIRQREQEALARIKNNPVKMALIRKSLDKNGKDKDGNTKEHKKKHKRKSGKHPKQSLSRHHSDSDEDSAEENDGRKPNHHKSSGIHDKHYERQRSDLNDESNRRGSHRETRHKEKYRDQSPNRRLERENHKTYGQDQSPNRRLERENHKTYGQEDRKRKSEGVEHEKYPSRGHRSSDIDRNRDGESRIPHGTSGRERDNDFQHRRRKGSSKLTEEERAARLRQMQMDAEVHEEQRWRRIKKADETDAKEANQNKVSIGKSFLDDANKSVYGIEKGGSSTIEESVRRRSYYSQRGSAAEGNAFRR